MEGDPPPALRGDVLLTHAKGAPNFARVVARGVRWVHVYGAGVEAFFASILDGAATMVDGKAGRGAIEWASLIDDAREKFNAPAQAFDRMIA